MSQARRFGGSSALQVAIALTFAVAAPGTNAPAEPAALPPAVGTTEIFVGDDWSGFAVGGFDPVSYFTPLGPQPGRDGVELIWGGLAWRFAGPANRAAFEHDPQVYAPRIGGYDPTAAAEGRLVAGAPILFLVSEGRLYLFRNDHARARFLADPTIAAKAEARWPELSRRLVRD